MGNYSYVFFLILGAFVIFFLIAFSVITVLWIALPFSVFGIKDLLRRSISEQEKTNKILESIIEANVARENRHRQEMDMPEKREDNIH